MTRRGELRIHLGAAPGVGKTFAMRGSAYADRVELRVADSGPGVPPGQREAPFAPFTRLDGAGPSDRGGASGVGLGLSVARGVAEAMGGMLTAEDTSGGGLTAVVALPAAHARRAPAPASRHGAPTIGAPLDGAGR